MNLPKKLTELTHDLNGIKSYAGLVFNTELIPGETDVLVVTIEDREEFPVYITVDESQILCITHVWKEAEIIPAKRTELLESLLMMNLPMPLSSFSKIGPQYIIFGALSTHSSLEELIEEIDVLSENTLIAIEELRDYFVK
ncbi:MAG: YjfI family protein [Thioploca sp.]|nr:YjfI family protein [Thioploca sp.]